jgi:hypothetical protein
MRLFFARPACRRGDRGACRRRAHILASPASSGLPIISGTPLTIALIHDAGTAGTNILMRSPADYHLPRHRACAGRSAPPAHIPRKDRLRRISPVPDCPGEGPLTEPTPAVQPDRVERVLIFSVFGRLPVSGVTRCSEAGVRKASGEETAGEFAPAVVSVYGDLACVCPDLWISNGDHG